MWWGSGKEVLELGFVGLWGSSRHDGFRQIYWEKKCTSDLCTFPFAQLVAHCCGKLALLANCA